MENQIELFKNPLSKAEQQDMAQKTIDLILNGEVNPIKAEIALKSMENVIKAIRTNEAVKSATSDETLKFGKSFSAFGADITNSQRTTNDFSECGDKIYNDLIAQQEKIKEQIKIREAIIKSGCDAATGECYNPPKTSTTSFLTIKFK
jgi:hypothetical protein